MRPGVSMSIMLGQWRYSIRTLISRLSKDRTGSFSSLRFSASMWSCISTRDMGRSIPSSPWRKQRGDEQRGLYCMRSATGRRVLVPPPTWLNWKPMRASMRADLPEDWWPTTTTAGASKGFWKSCWVDDSCAVMTSIVRCNVRAVMCQSVSFG